MSTCVDSEQKSFKFGLVGLAVNVSICTQSTHCVRQGRIEMIVASPLQNCSLNLNDVSMSSERNEDRLFVCLANN